MMFIKKDGMIWLQAISLEMGAPIDFSTQLQAGTGASHIKSYIKVLKEYTFEAKLGEHALNNNILHEPKGVCALITPWNWPMNQVCLKVIPAIAAGCTMVLKPSEIAPLSSMILAEMIDEIKLPKGIFNLVNGDGAVAGNTLTSHPDVNMISFTGSTRAGALISENAAKDFKRVSLELGGKGAKLYLKMLMLKLLKEERLDVLEIQDNLVMLQQECWLKNQSMQMQWKELRILLTL